MDLQSIISLATQVATEAVTTASEAAHAAEDAGIAGMFGISWKLFIAQLINFGIVLLVLWKWVFGPVTKALKKRTARINQSLVDAGTIEYEKQQLEQSKKEILAEARREAAGIVASSKDEAEKVKADILAKAKEEHAKILEQTKKQMEQESIKAVAEVKKKVADLVVSATETILNEKIDIKKDQGLIARALEAIKQS